uniref:Uncharacterized protein n=1 Tax=Setaria italica TaxID=4555 RepID=K3XUI7_SETIT
MYIGSIIAYPVKNFFHDRFNHSQILTTLAGNR